MALHDPQGYLRCLEDRRDWTLDRSVVRCQPIGDGLNRRQRRKQRSSVSIYSVLSSHRGSPIHRLFSQASGITPDVIGAAIEVHQDQGPGLLESIYDWCLTMELELRGHLVKNQKNVVIRYKHFRREEPLRR